MARTFFDQSDTDIALYSFVTGAQDAMRTISDTSAINRFIKRFGNICGDCSEDALQHRLRKMRELYNDTLKTV